MLVAKAGMKGVMVVRKERFDLLQTLNLEHLWSLLNHLPTL